MERGRRCAAVRSWDRGGDEQLIAAPGAGFPGGDDQRFDVAVFEFSLGAWGSAAFHVGRPVALGDDTFEAVRAGDGGDIVAPGSVGGRRLPVPGLKRELVEQLAAPAVGQAPDAVPSRCSTSKTISVRRGVASGQWRMGVAAREPGSQPSEVGVSGRVEAGELAVEKPMPGVGRQVTEVGELRRQSTPGRERRQSACVVGTDLVGQAVGQNCQAASGSWRSVAVTRSDATRLRNRLGARNSLCSGMPEEGLEPPTRGL